MTEGRPSSTVTPVATDPGGPTATARPPAPVVVTLRPATSADRFLIRRWLSETAVARPWGGAAAAEAAITLALATPVAVARMILADGVPVGYGHAADIALLDRRGGHGLAPGTYEIELFVGAIGFRGRGLGRRAAALLVDEVFTTTLAVACAVLPVVAHEATVRAYESAGFQWQRIWYGAGREPTWVMLRERPVRR